MSINIDSVYQTVQALANKEQRGYITPQEFNLFANQAQQDIFEQYLYDLNAFKRQAPEQFSIGDSVGMIKAKLGKKLATKAVTGGTALPDTDYIGEIYLGQGAVRRTLKEVDPDIVIDFNKSPFHKKGFTDAVYFNDGPFAIQAWDGAGQITTGLTVEYIKARPGLCFWAYTVINEEALYLPSQSVNIDLHSSEQSDIVVKILKLAGISTEDQQLFAAASAEDGLNTQQENK